MITTRAKQSKFQTFECTSRLKIKTHKHSLTALLKRILSVHRVIKNDNQFSVSEIHAILKTSKTLLITVLSRNDEVQPTELLWMEVIKIYDFVQ